MAEKAPAKTYQAQRTRIPAGARCRFPSYAHVGRRRPLLGYRRPQAQEQHLLQESHGKKEARRERKGDRSGRMLGLGRNSPHHEGLTGQMVAIRNPRDDQIKHLGHVTTSPARTSTRLRHPSCSPSQLSTISAQFDCREGNWEQFYQEFGSGRIYAHVVRVVHTFLAWGAEARPTTFFHLQRDNIHPLVF